MGMVQNFRIGKTAVGKMGKGEKGVGEMGVGKTGTPRLKNHHENDQVR